MSNYTYSLDEKIVDFNGETLRVLCIHLEIVSGKIPVRAARLIVKVVNNVTIVESWMCIISGNRKEVDAWFTVDAFDGFSGNSVISIGFGKEMPELIEDVSLTFTPASPPDPTATDATNVWLLAITDSSDSDI